MPERRINIRVENELFEALDDKRQAHRTTFQEIGLSLWQRWLTGEIPDRKDEQKMTTGTETPDSSGKFGTLSPKDAPNYPKIVQKRTGQGTDLLGQEADQVMESEDERSPTEIPITRADAARIEAKVDRLIASLAEGRAGVGGVANPLEIAKKTAGRTDRAKHLVPRRKRKHPPGAQSGA